ncbi:MAG TPA: hypothetical protein VF297_01550 [Pyrinomonadaceae bacterium]
MAPPRMHFSGQFWTNPSTINNATENYNLDEVYNNEPPSDTNPNSVWWNKSGQAFFKITSGTVNSAFGKDGSMLPAGGDSILGAQIVSVIAPPPGSPGGNQTPQHGRLVDLDPDQQARSMIVGLRLQITIPSEPGVSLSGTIRPMCIIDLWGRVIGGSGSGIASAGAMYQSVLDDVQWQGIDKTKSAFLKQLYAASPRALSFKMNVDGYNGNVQSDQFAFGRVVGTIGPYVSGEPAHFLAARRVFTGAEAVAKDFPQGNSPMNAAPFQIKGTKLVIDLGNSVPTTAVNAGPFMNLGTVSAVIDPMGAKQVVTPPLFTSPAQFATQYKLTAGVFELDLGANASKLQNKPLGIQIAPPSATSGAADGLPAVQMKTGIDVSQIDVPGASAAGTKVALAEWQNGLFVDVDFNALRLQKGAPAWGPNALTGTEITSNAQIPLVATRFGQPASGLSVKVSLTTNQYQFRNDQGQFYNINNAPLSAISAPPQPLVTDANGRVAIPFSTNGLSAAQRQQRRADIDGQLYYFTHDYSMDGLQPISLLVFEDSPYVANPTWWDNVYPIFLQYARLYPAMRDLIDLSDYATVTNTAFGIPAKIQMVFGLPMSHPGYMPVTRDLSLLNLEMIMRWFANGMPEGTQPTET